jgi:hypothetical protein
MTAPAPEVVCDGDAIARVLGGDTEAFRGLVERYEAPVPRLVRNLASRSNAHEDIAQDVFVSAFVALASFDARRGSFLTWFFAIAKHKCINARRKMAPLLVDRLPPRPPPTTSRTPRSARPSTRPSKLCLTSSEPKVYMMYILRRTEWLSCGCVLAALAGCGGTPASGAGDAQANAAPLPSRLAVTADWLHHTVSLVDFDTLVSALPASDASVPEASVPDGSVPDASTADASVSRVGEIDVSAYGQAPYSVTITPDGTTALVSMSAGFFTVPGAGALVNASSIPTGPGEVLFIDLASRSVVASLDTGSGATGIAITHDGSRAFICHAGTSDVTVVDVQTRQILQQVDVGGTFAEEIALDDTDTVGIVTYLDSNTESKDVRTFAVADWSRPSRHPFLSTATPRACRSSLDRRWRTWCLRTTH